LRAPHAAPNLAGFTMHNPSRDYDFASLEPRWQRFWAEHQAFRAETGAPRPKFYLLDMFPYPSGAGLHLGHCENYTITDIVARYRRARGDNVLYPIGWDAFGLPTENYAVKTGRHPREVTIENVATFRRQLQALGVSYDFSREVDTTDPRYFRWTQWIWLQLFRRGLAYVEEKPVWWCPALGTVLANEEVIDGRSEVGGHPVERRPLRQWVLRITAYADRLLDDLKQVDWPDSTKRMQEAWIGRSEGAELQFALEDAALGALKVYTTRPDTIFGATYMVLAPEHPLVDALTTPAQREAVATYRRAAAAKSDLERTDLAKDKSGVFTGSYARNPVNDARIPIWVADYVLMGYGTGAIMAVPAHDTRDHEFAVKFELPIVPVIQPEGEPVPLPYVGEGRLINSGRYDGLPWAEAKRRITADLAQRGRGRAAVNYRLRDWLFSRQRYWGEPFPIVWVSETDYASALAATRAAGVELPVPAAPVTAAVDGEVRCALPLPESALPLKLPPVQSYQPTGTGESPLAAIPEWIEVWYRPDTGAAVPASQPRPGDGAMWVRGRRESNTMPQWAGSCWYYLRYTDPHCADALASPAALRYWGSPDLYVGGAEHAVLHLLYARFWHKVLFDLGVVPTAEPFPRLFHQGIILGEDGEKMSKSRGNVANPDEVIRAYGTDTLRLYLMFLGPPEATKPWDPKGIEGVHRFLKKVWREFIGDDGRASAKLGDTPDDPELARVYHATIKKVGDDIEGLRLNTAISQLMICANAVQRAATVHRDTARGFLRLLAPFAPHFAEELWSRLGGEAPIHRHGWPAFDPARLVASEITVVVQVNGKLRGDLRVAPDITEAAAVALAQAHPKVVPHLSGKALRKAVFVPGKLVNLVVG
jgi:leucyl-tRNA synthetase